MEATCFHALSRITTVEATLRVPANAEAGEWTFALWLSDASPGLQNNPDYAVRLASSTFYPATGYNVFPISCIDDSAPGEVDPEASEFVVIPL